MLEETFEIIKSSLFPNTHLGWWEQGEQLLGLTVAWEGFRGEQEGGRTVLLQKPPLARDRRSWAGPGH